MNHLDPQKVLIVEDSRSFAAMLRELIVDSHGLELDIAEDLAQTKALLEAHPDEYFAAIVDFHLPDAPNGEAIDAVVVEQIPTIVFTGRADSDLQDQLWRKGIADYASKVGRHNLEYVTWMVKRIQLNRRVETLVVDDSLTARRAVVALLKRQNFIVHEAKSGEEALAILEENTIRLAVIDCNMDGMDGLELTSQIRETHSRASLEVIGISSQGDRGLAAEFIKSGANDFILKPLIPEEFLCRVNNAIDRVEAYLELKKLNVIKNRLLGTAAHDIRGPLGSIKTAAEFLMNRSPSPERREKLTAMIGTASKGLLNLLENLLDISVIESGVMKLSIEPCNLSEAVHERIELYQSQAASKGIILQYKISPDVVVSADEVKIKQVFDNLLTNAIKFSEQNSTVRIKLKKDNENAHLTIQDAGPGIPEDEQAHLFKPFSTLTTKATGREKKTGLGLAIVKTVVDAHKGNIYYANTPSAHSTFYLDLQLEQ